MKLSDFHTHLSNEGVDHAYRRADLRHDIYKCNKTGITCTLCIDEDLDDELAVAICEFLNVDCPPDLDHLKEIQQNEA